LTTETKYSSRRVSRINGRVSRLPPQRICSSNRKIL
jgi:hypothetical protein